MSTFYQNSQQGHRNGSKIQNRKKIKVFFIVMRFNNYPCKRQKITLIKKSGLANHSPSHVT
jgi:hypothetical protein